MKEKVLRIPKMFIADIFVMQNSLVFWYLEKYIANISELFFKRFPPLLETLHIPEAINLTVFVLFVPMGQLSLQ